MNLFSLGDDASLLYEALCNTRHDNQQEVRNDECFLYNNCTDEVGDQGVKDDFDSNFCLGNNALSDVYGQQSFFYRDNLIDSRNQSLCLTNADLAAFIADMENNERQHGSNEVSYDMGGNQLGNMSNSMTSTWLNASTAAPLVSLAPSSSTSGSTPSTSGPRRRGRPQNTDLDPDEPCHVCHVSKAGRHLHYGGRVCKACKAFFRRAVKQRLLSKFRCIDDNKQCDINNISAKCQYCRFQKCLRVGMRVAWVAPNEESNSEPALPALSKQSAPVGVDEMAQITATLRVLQLLSGHSFYRFLVQKSSPLMLPLVRHGFFGGVMSFELSEHFLNMFHCLIHFVMLDELRGLSTRDRASLVEHNAPMLGVFKSCIVMTERDSCLSQELGDVTDYIWQLNELEPSEKERIEKLRRDAGMKPFIQYDQVFASPWAANVDDEVRHWELTVEIGRWPSTTGDEDSAETDHLQVAMMKLVMAMSTDHVPHLDNRDLCDQLQARFLTMLQRYLRFRFGAEEGRRRLMQGMHVINMVREALIIRQRRIRV